MIKLEREVFFDAYLFISVIKTLHNELQIILFSGIELASSRIGYRRSLAWILLAGLINDNKNEFLTL